MPSHRADNWLCQKILSALQLLPSQKPTKKCGYCCLDDNCSLFPNKVYGGTDIRVFQWNRAFVQSL